MLPEHSQDCSLHYHTHDPIVNTDPVFARTEAALRVLHHLDNVHTYFNQVVELGQQEPQGLGHPKCEYHRELGDHFQEFIGNFVVIALFAAIGLEHTLVVGRQFDNIFSELDTHFDFFDELFYERH